MVLIGALLSAQASTETLCAEGTNAPAPPASMTGTTDANTLGIIKQLQRRIEELEQKVRALEGGRVPAQEPGDAKARQQVQELDQKVKVLERQRELDQEAQEAKAKEAPRISIGQDGFLMPVKKGQKPPDLRYFKETQK